MSGEAEVAGQGGETGAGMGSKAVTKPGGGSKVATPVEGKSFSIIDV